MLGKESQNNIIHFYQRVIDKTTLIRFTTDFTLKIFELFYKKQAEGDDFDEKESNKIIRSIQASLFADINKYIKDAQIRNEDVIEITFERDSSIPSVILHREDEPTDVEYADPSILLHVYFKKISWNEINEFRVFFVRYMTYYLTKFHSGDFKDVDSISRNVSNASYVVQELLQNANAYSFDMHDYELVLKYNVGAFDITVRNFAEQKNVAQLQEIVKEISDCENHEELLLKYMLNEEKHLGLITSIYNYNISKYNVNYLEDKIVEIHFVIDTEF
ncbi:MAG: hypothetical protein IKQ61_00850 [Spirochaetales bacterium]|nr:hypothetical protein [Spirochaetales bacterium]